MCRRALFSLLVVLCAAWATPLWAQNYYSPDPYGPGVQPLDRILPAVRNGRPGRFYDAEGPFPDASGGYHYRIKWLTPQGRVVWLDTDARTGRVSGTDRGDWREQGPPPVMPDYGGGPDRYGPPYAGSGREGPRGNGFYGPPGESYGRPPGPPDRGGWQGHGGDHDDRRHDHGG